MMEFINNLFELAKATWAVFCMAPVTCILLFVILICYIPVHRRFWKRIDESKGPIIFW